MKLISYFTGTDSLLISRWNFPCSPYKRVYQLWIRLRTFFIDFIVDEYLVDSESLVDDLRTFGINKKIMVKEDALKYTVALPKQDHIGFNVLYYYPGDRGNSKMWRWIYGYDIYLELKDNLSKVNFIVVDGTHDMSDIFPIVDFYLRPNRHDGSSRLRRECEIQKIPYYWTIKNPDVEKIKAAIAIWRI